MEEGLERFKETEVVDNFKETVFYRNNQIRQLQDEFTYAPMHKVCTGFRQAKKKKKSQHEPGEVSRQSHPSGGVAESDSFFGKERLFMMRPLVGHPLFREGWTP